VDLVALNTIFAALTLVVVAAAAVAAVIQLRHLRASNQLNGLLTVLETWQNAQFQEWMEFVRDELPVKITEPAFIDSLRKAPVNRRVHPELHVCDWYEQVGSYMKNGLLDERSFLDIISANANEYWMSLWPVIAILRERRGPSVYENFEYLAVRGRLWNKKFPNGYYPRGTPRIAELDARDAGPSAAPSES
jgi:hypothetical protein